MTCTTIALSGLVARPSLEYVASAFDLYRQRRPFVALASPSAAAGLPGIRIDEVIEPAVTSGWFDGRHEVEHGPDTAQVSFTSGTTGTPKGIILSHDALADTTKRLIAVQQLDASVREYVGVPPNYSFGLARYRAIAAIGGRAYMPAKGFDPAELGRMLHDGEVNALSAVPTLLRLLIEHAEVIGAAGAAMRWIEIGSQYMTRSDKEAVKALFPHARIVQHFGLTEASRTTFLDVSGTSGVRLESVGQPVGDTEIGLLADGRIRVRGTHVAREYIDNDGVIPLVDAEGWLETNDLGEINDGFLFFRGRADDLINCAGIKLVPDIVEERLRARLGVARRIAVARIPDPLRGDGVLVATDDAAASVDEMRVAALDVLATFGVTAGASLRVELVNRLPVTETGKIQRRALAAMIAPPPGDEPDAAAVDDLASDVLQTFQLAFPRRKIGRDDSLVSLGGDSLAHVSILLRLDEPTGRLPPGWEERSIAELERTLAPQVAPPASEWRPLGSEVVLRAAAIVFIVAHHAMWIDLGGGIDVLLLLVGVNLSRFQTGRLASPRRWTLVGDILLRLVLPYYIMLGLFRLLYSQPVFAADIFLFSNFIGRYHGATLIYWFVQGYLQTIVLLAGLATLPSVRRMIVEQPGRFGATFLVLALAIKVASLRIFHHEALLGRTPDQFIYIVALGWCVQQARTGASRAVVATFAFVVMLLDLAAIPGLWSGFDGRWHTTALFIATFVLLYVPAIRLPPLFRLAAISIATASLMSYLSHPLLMTMLEPTFRRPLLGLPHTRTLSLLLLVALLLLLAIALNRLLQTILRRVSGLTTR